MEKVNYEDLMDMCQDFIYVYDTLYKLKTFNKKEINKIYLDIKGLLLETKQASPNQILTIISTAMIHNIKYLKQYKAIFNKIYKEYHPIFTHNELKNIPHILWADLSDENGVLLSEKYIYDFARNKYKYSTTNFMEENTIYRAIMYDDKFSFIAFIETDGFNKDQMLENDLYPSKPLSLIELCCYHGAVNCFKYLITRFKSTITQKCLWYSFLGGNSDIIQECLKIEEPDEECMRYAIISHNIDFISFLMSEYEFEIDLYNCVIYHNLQAFLVYLDQSKYINKFFIYSVCFCIPSLCEYFLSHGADVNSKTEIGRTALHFAAEFNCIKIAESLISHGADVNAKDNDGHTVLCQAAYNNSKKIFELLISHGADINAKDNKERSNLHYAAENSSIEIVEFLISHGADVNAKDNIGFSSLLYAAYSSNLETIQLLVSHGADVNSVDISGESVLGAAIFENHKDIVEFLISHGADVNAKRGLERLSALHKAVEESSIEIVELLISHGADVNDKDNNGESILHFAAYRKCKEIAELLISHGADVNDKDNNGDSILHIAVDRNSKEIVELLISHGADVNDKDNDGDSILHIAAYRKCKEIAELLISHGADVNAKNNNGDSILHAAAKNNYIEIVELLISHGADVNAEDNDGLSVLYAAAIDNHKEIVELLISKIMLEYQKKIQNDNQHWFNYQLF
ncbi:ankyrin repeat protein, putative [Trichomonas vaginalis G3]|uniref:Ankyrin repeat protein, putative n=1 Tax=Trichomonas vaginalis (strain ATCC PRA-98 / G3) TaxID=412133 RepID=A2E5I8_TRIV3|nr:myotrophin family [Trichomonas vaginalis G3]EAY12029.1 ankyrin repeat protein, putative [Trichomonas vaginalis G3]KAI5485498.1 myotrophin family [Trichomonas vaginalis G3]|eukprot:XP_001324252.1 ankyrin repeat protein [Trichomonas vaginalis G3]